MRVWLAISTPALFLNRSRFLSPFDHCASKEWITLYVSFPVIILVSFGAGNRGATSGALHIQVFHGVVLSALATV
jgi:hypothetical protein